MATAPASRREGSTVHTPAVSHRHADLSIQTQVTFFLSGLDLDFDLDRIAHYHWTMRQSVRRDGRNDEGVHVRFEDRPARSERIRGRTGRRRDDQTISFVTGNELPVHETLEVIQARDGP